MSLNRLFNVLIALALLVMAALTVRTAISTSAVRSSGSAALADQQRVEAPAGASDWYERQPSSVNPAYIQQNLGYIQERNDERFSPKCELGYIQQRNDERFGPECERPRVP